MPDEPDATAGSQERDDPPRRVRIPVASIRTDAPQFQIAARNRVGPRSWRAPVSCWRRWLCRLRRGVLAELLQLLARAHFSVGFGGLGYGMVVWGKYLMPRGLSQSRGTTSRRPCPARGVRPGLRESREGGSRAPGLLVKTLGLASGILGVVLAMPFIRSLVRFRTRCSARPRGGAARTSSTSRAQDQDGDLEVGGFTTVFPETDIGGA